MNMHFISPVPADNAAAIITSELPAVTYGKLREWAAEFSQSYRGGFALLVMSNNQQLLGIYASLVEAKIPVMLIDHTVETDYVVNLVNIYQPSILVNSPLALVGYSEINHESGISIGVASKDYSPVSAELGMMLGTSGSTGNPKFVRLSHNAIRANSRDISAALRIQEDDIAITSLPSSYTYGLSVINSHLWVGARIVSTDSSLVAKEFWDQVNEFGVTSVAGVPTSYRFLRQMRWNPDNHKSLRTFTQAGGKLQDDERLFFLSLLGSKNIDFFVMYGQTEATARITVAPPSLLKRHIGTAGYPIPNGEISIINSDGPIGEVVYSGPNVMLGYAENSEDLVAGDTQEGRLLTGDLGYIEDGALFLTGRSKRIVKVFGIRVSLDDIETWLQQFGGGVAVQANDKVGVFIFNGSSDISEVRSSLSTYLGLHQKGISVEFLEEVPLLSSGKIDIQMLQKLAEES